MDFTFFITAIGLAIGLAMDAFSISLANGLNEPKMKFSRVCGVAGTFGIFQGVMPMIGWICVHTILTYFESLQKFIPFIAMALLSYIGIKMIIDGVNHKCGDTEYNGKLGFGMLMVQGIATSIDALSVGFVIADYSLTEAMVSSLIIAALTFVICIAGIKIGNVVGCRFAGKASIFGGVILLIIGLEIVITSFL